MSAVHGMRNPMNSWDKSDSYETHGEYGDQFFFGESDLALAKKLTQAGPDHRKFLRQIMVSMDITAPLYWWKEYDTYKVGTVANSCSTMHKIHVKEFTLDDFSHERLMDYSDVYLRSVLCEPQIVVLGRTISTLNIFRRLYLETKDKDYWWQMIQLLPSSYNQLRTVTMTYENLLNMYRARKGHKLDEWQRFCDTVAELPYFDDLIIAKELNNHDNQNPTADA
jgi:hypothetical protein